MRYAVIIPACNEEECIGPVLRELRRHLDSDAYVVAVGVNGSTDRTAEIARAEGALVAETPDRGYGYGCDAAIRLVERVHGTVAGLVFFAGDGASDPADVPAVVSRHRAGIPLVIGSRTRSQESRRTMGFRYVLANVVLGAICLPLGGRWFSDLGPLRVIDWQLFQRMRMREWTFGWTIEAQVLAARMGVPSVEVPVSERPRLAGTQKVSRVSWRQTLYVGTTIMAAGVRSRLRPLPEAVATPEDPPEAPAAIRPAP